MNIHTNNIKLIEKFINLHNSTTFRYFQNRTIDCINNHVVTIIGELNNIPIAYGHIDYENKYWIGLCVLNEYQEKGYGSTILKSLLELAKNTNINKLHLTVDIDNIRAIKLYKKYGFSIENENNKFYTMMLELN